MIEYWESRFKNEGEMWKSEPSDSAKKCSQEFLKCKNRSNTDTWIRVWQERPGYL